MAKELSLKRTIKEDGAITVSWTDLEPKESEKSAIPLAVAGIGFIVCMVMTIATESFIFLLLGAIGIIAAGISPMKPKDFTNLVIFAKDSVTHKGISFPTDEVTRFEYGLRSQLTNTPAASKYGGAPIDPHVIRMWVNDSSAHYLSTNSLSMEDNHRIRNALDSAIREVRGAEAKREQEEKYGKITKDGIPDYD